MLRPSLRASLALVGAAIASCDAPPRPVVAPVDVPAAIDAPAPVDVSTARDVPAADRPADVVVAPAVGTCRGPALVAWTSDPRLCLTAFATGLRRPRGLAFAVNGDLFLTDGDGISVLHDDDGDGTSGPAERARFTDSMGVSHGLAFSPDGAFVYASTPTEVLRWPYTRGLRVSPAKPTRVVIGMPPGGHAVRAIVFGPDGRLYVDVGSGGNLDQSPADLSLRSMIRRFVIPATLARPMDYASGEVIASGMRNESGLAFDRAGRLWGVENGRDSLARPIGNDIHIDNPAEELNLIDTVTPRFYGYPSCFSEGLLPGRDPANVRPPAFAMPAHWAPLGVTEYTGSLLPWRGSLLIASHGSWNRESMQNGRLVARADVATDGTVRSLAPVVGELRGGALVQGTWDAKPVDLREGPDGAVYVSDDLGNRVLRIGYRRAD